MLERLYVKDFAIVGETEIGFGDGMTVVTGETGAGKSLLVDALLLLSGARSDSSVVRHGCDRAELSASFHIDGGSTAAQWLSDEDLDDDGACELRRVIRSEGQSRAWINGRPVTLQQLRELGDLLIGIHGQHDQQALLERGRQRELLDAFAGHRGLVADVQATARAWQRTRDEIRGIDAGGDAGERIDWLRHQIDELERVVMAPAAFAELEAEHRRLGHAGQLVQGSTAIADLVDGDGDATLRQQLAKARHEVQRLAALDPGLAAVAEAIDAARIQIDEAGDALRRYRDRLDVDPARLQALDDQIGRLHELARKHRVPIDGLPAKLDELRSEIDTLADAGRQRGELSKRLAELAARWRDVATQLTASRQRSAATMSASITALMQELGMQGGRFAVTLHADDHDEPAPNGAESCEFDVAANPGQPLRALRKVASGGELSRISLALEVAMLGLDAVQTMVFDEVDTGIGGSVATAVGEKLRRLGSQRQVLCVTHLPQVAAQGHRHLSVNKSTNAGETSVTIATLDENRRVDELARMGGDREPGDAAREHARQMLAQARAAA